MPDETTMPDDLAACSAAELDAAMTRARRDVGDSPYAVAGYVFPRPLTANEKRVAARWIRARHPAPPTPDETPPVAPALTSDRLRWLASWLESGDCGHAGDADIAPLRALADALEAITREDVRELRRIADEADESDRFGEKEGPRVDSWWATSLADKLAALFPPEG